MSLGDLVGDVWMHPASLRTLYGGVRVLSLHHCTDYASRASLGELEVEVATPCNESCQHARGLALPCYTRGKGSASLEGVVAQTLGSRMSQRSPAQWASVCSGSLLLGKAGLLVGRRATSHWRWLKHLASFGAEPVNERVGIDDKVMTAAGVSSGIDMALTLLGVIADEQTAQTVQLAIEYDPRPPFDAGSPETAPGGLTARALELIR